jgi:formylglycine-generating enzyme required for sulfatase activity
MKSNPSYYSATGKGKEVIGGRDTSRFPVERIRWFDAVEFCTKLSIDEGLTPSYRIDGEEVTFLSGMGYRLPTEAEWEFACRAGTEGKYWIGETIDDLQKVGWYQDNSGQRPNPVGQLSPNPFGLFDVHGNVWEWCVDRWDPQHYARYGNKSAIDPEVQTASDTKLRVARGGSWGDAAPVLRSANRGTQVPNHMGGKVGFRVALSLDAVKLKVQRAR